MKKQVLDEKINLAGLKISDMKTDAITIPVVVAASTHPLQFSLVQSPWLIGMLEVRRSGEGYDRVVFARKALSLSSPHGEKFDKDSLHSDPRTSSNIMSLLSRSREAREMLEKAEEANIPVVLVTRNPISTGHRTSNPRLQYMTYIDYQKLILHAADISTSFSQAATRTAFLDPAARYPELDAWLSKGSAKFSSVYKSDILKLSQSADPVHDFFIKIETALKRLKNLS